MDDMSSLTVLTDDRKLEHAMAALRKLSELIGPLGWWGSWHMNQDLGTDPDVIPAGFYNEDDPPIGYDAHGPVEGHENPTIVEPLLPAFWASNGGTCNPGAIKEAREFLAATLAILT